MACPVPARNSEGAEKPRVLRFTAMMSPACLSWCVPSSRLLPADSAVARFWIGEHRSLRSNIGENILGHDLNLAIGARHRQVRGLQPGRELAQMGESTADSAISLSKAGCCRLYVPAVRDVLSHFGLREIALRRARL